MKFYTKTHQHYCGIDLHTKSQYLCILNELGEIVLHKNMPAKPKPFINAIKPYREDLIVGVECMFSWYWLADLCAKEEITFILGYALYMTKSSGMILPSFSWPAGENTGRYFITSFMVAKPSQTRLIVRK